MTKTWSFDHRIKGWRIRSRVILGGVVALILLSISLVIASNGAFGVFVATGESSTRIGAGTVMLSWNDTLAPQLSMVVGPLHPNESAEFALNLANTGDVALSTIQIGLIGTGTGTPSDGFQLAIDSCSVPWVSHGSSLTCEGGSGEAVAAERPVNGLINLPSSEALTVHGIDYLRFTYRLSDSAPEIAEGSSGTIAITATGTQRAGREE